MVVAATFFPNSVSLGSSVIVKVPEQVGAAKSGFPTGLRGRVSFKRVAPDLVKSQFYTSFISREKVVPDVPKWIKS